MVVTMLEAATLGVLWPAIYHILGWVTVLAPFELFVVNSALMQISIV